MDGGGNRETAETGELGVGSGAGPGTQQRTATALTMPVHPASPPPPPESQDLCSFSMTGSVLLSGSARLWPKPDKGRSAEGMTERTEGTAKGADKGEG